MRVVAFVTQKGGTGKSSLAVSLAVAAQEGGAKTYLLDLDQQGTEAPEVAAIEASRVPAALGTLKRQGVQLVIIDTPGVDSPATVAAMQAADLCVIPARPSIADIEATRPTVQSLMKLGRPFCFVLNQVPAGRSGRASDAFRVLQLSGAVAAATLATRTDHVDALAQGLGVTERDPAGKAAAEIRELLAWLTQRMEGKTDG